MKIHRVNSSLISFVGHNPETNTLRVVFPRKGEGYSHYNYSNFSAEMFAGFLAAESQGKYFLQNIKKETEKFPFYATTPTLEELAQIEAIEESERAAVTE